MATINISITESEIQIIDGIPKYITFESNIPCNIFYTLDGNIPDLNSQLVIDNIYLPTEFESITLKYLAMDGVDSIYGEYTWNPDKAVGPKIFSKVTDSPINQKPQQYNLYPFGSPNIPTPGQFGDTALEPVDAPDKANVDFMGYGADGEPAGFTDKSVSQYQLIAPPGSGERPNNLGTFNKAPDILFDNDRISQFTSTTINKLFNPRAMVMYQDGNDPNVDPNISSLNKQFFYSNNLSSMDGANSLFVPAHQGSSLGGSFIRYFINKQEQTIKFYYFDSQTCRWIISTEPYNMSNLYPESLANLIFPPDTPAERHVYRWIPYVTGRYM